METFINSREYRLGRLGVILASKFENISIEVDFDESTVFLKESGFSVIAYVFKDGHIEWRDFDDANITWNRKESRLSGEIYFQPIISKIEQYYYSSEYECASEAKEYLSRIKKKASYGAFSGLIGMVIYTISFWILFPISQEYGTIGITVFVISSLAYAVILRVIINRIMEGE